MHIPLELESEYIWLTNAENPTLSRTNVAAFRVAHEPSTGLCLSRRLPGISPSHRVVPPDFNGYVPEPDHSEPTGDRAHNICPLHVACFQLITSSAVAPNLYATNTSSSAVSHFHHSFSFRWYHLTATVSHIGRGHIVFPERSDVETCVWERENECEVLLVGVAACAWTVSVCTPLLVSQNRKEPKSQTASWFLCRLLFWNDKTCQICFANMLKPTFMSSKRFSKFTTCTFQDMRYFQSACLHMIHLLNNIGDQQTRSWWSTQTGRTCSMNSGAEATCFIVQSCFSGGWWHDGWSVSVSEQSESVMMLIRRCFSKPTPPCLITVFFLYPWIPSSCGRGQVRLFYLQSINALKLHHLLEQSNKGGSHLSFVILNAGSVIDEVWRNPSTITSAIRTWYWDGGNADAVKGLPLLLWIVSSNYPDLTIHLWQRSHVTPEALEICHADAGTAPYSNSPSNQGGLPL